MKTDYEKDVKIFKALCDVKRLRILELLRRGEKCVCVLIEEMDMGQSSISYHMKILCEAGLVTGRQEGKWTHYRLNGEGGKYALSRLSEIIEAAAGNDAKSSK